jgi:short-subunit dehydrogenase
MNKKILIVGATSGLGRRLAELYAEEGCQLGIIGRRENLLKEIEQKYPGQVFYRKADIKDENIDRNIKELITAINGADIIILTASVIHFNTSFLLAPETDTVNINVKGYLQVLNTAWYYFKEKGSGHIVGITSVAGVRGNKVAPAYNASKAFQSNYLEGMRLKAKYEKNNITVTELMPGYIDTDMSKGDRLFWVASVNKASLQSKKAIAKKRQEHSLRKDGGWFTAFRNFCRFLFMI